MRARLTFDKNSVVGCESLGVVSDDDLKDLAKKATKMGGNIAVIMANYQEQRGAAAGGVLGFRSTQFHTSEVFRCPR